MKALQDLIVSTVVALLVTATSAQAAQSVQADDHEIENIVRRTYQYVAMYNVINKCAMMDDNPFRTGWNDTVALDQLADHTVQLIARPNNDTLYVTSTLDLRPRRGRHSLPRIRLQVRLPGNVRVRPLLRGAALHDERRLREAGQYSLLLGAHRWLRWRARGGRGPDHRTVGRLRHRLPARDAPCRGTGTHEEKPGGNAGGSGSHARRIPGPSGAGGRGCRLPRLQQ